MGISARMAKDMAVFRWRQVKDGEMLDATSRGQSYSTRLLYRLVLAD